jgi:hypothetical protein
LSRHGAARKRPLDVTTHRWRKLGFSRLLIA